MAKDVDVGESFELPVVEEFESAQGGVDLSEFEGKKAKIAGYTIIDSVSSYDESGNALPLGKTIPVKRLKVFTGKITEFDGPDGKIPVRATELFTMKQQGGKWGVSTHPKAKISKLIAKVKAKNLKGIVGKEVVLRTRETPQGGTFLGFYIE